MQAPDRELEVLQRLVVGQSNAEIGATLGIAERTIKFHINNIFTKLGVSEPLEELKPNAYGNALVADANALKRWYKC